MTLWCDNCVVQLPNQCTVQWKSDPYSFIYSPTHQKKGDCKKLHIWINMRSSSIYKQALRLLIISVCVLSGKVKEKADKLEKPVKPPKPTKPEKPEKQDKRKTPLIPPTQPVVTHPVPTPIVTTPSSSRRPDSPCSSGTDQDDSIANHTVQVFINHACEAGPHLSAAKVAGLPTCFRGTVLNVARDCIQSVVNAAVEPEVVFGFLKPGNGKTRITAKGSKKTLSCTLQNIDRVAIFWRVLEKFSDNLQCCENLFCGERITGPCSKCGKSGKILMIVA